MHSRVAQVVGKHLHVVRAQLGIVVQYVIVRWPRGALNALVRAQVEVVFDRMRDVLVDNGARSHILQLHKLFLAQFKGECSCELIRRANEGEVKVRFERLFLADDIFDLITAVNALEKLTRGFL